MTQDAGFPEQTHLIEKLTTATDGEEVTNEQVVDVINAFLNSQVVFPSVDKAGDDGSVSPLMLQDTDGNPVMPLFTSPDNIPDDFAEAAPHVSVVPGSAIIQSVTDAGIVIDFGTSRQFGLGKEQVAAVREEIISQLGQA
ncbi:SseB family protein [Enteractinococcus coprophilus]|uniref:Type III secretion system (T3SS) SseB-like protein n=1 Tax=Enteractinococcus coprophilus TaxID=1027633 RepID=A0A543AMI7_9MICC|nr:SseB family protein [Enteractinococcus coprophilus]TQL73807.1 type III secretion system (T3SS) SseB-like protein [Enteractinococcus coprophilus]